MPFFNKIRKNLTLTFHGFTQVNHRYFEATTPFDMGKENMVGEMIPIDPEALRSQNEFQHHLKTRVKINEIGFQTSMVPTGKQIEELVDLIRTELKK